MLSKIICVLKPIIPILAVLLASFVPGAIISTIMFIQSVVVHGNAIAPIAAGSLNEAILDQFFSVLAFPPLFFYGYIIQLFTQQLDSPMTMAGYLFPPLYIASWAFPALLLFRVKRAFCQALILPWSIVWFVAASVAALHEMAFI